MSSLRLIYQSLILVALCHYGLGQKHQYKVCLQSVKIEGYPEPFSDAILGKDRNTGKIEFLKNDALNQACGSFEPSQVEITDFFDREMKFSFARPGDNDVLHLTCSVTFTSHVLNTFFNDVRSQQMNDCEEKIEIKNLFQFPKIVGGTLTPLPHVNEFFVKSMNSEWFNYPRSFNFIHRSGEVQEPKLIFQALEFNVTRIDDDKYLLCVLDLYRYYFVVQFPNKSNAKKFHDSVGGFLNTELGCSTDWLTVGIMATIDSY